MKRDEHEMLVEYSEMTTFNFNSKEYQDVKEDFKKCEEAAHGFEWLVKNFFVKFRTNVV